MSIKAENEAYWTTRVEQTNLYKDLEFLGKIAMATAKGTMTKCQLVSGIPGVGKTHAYRSALDAEGCGYELVKAGSVLGLIQELERCAASGKVALLDDPKRAILESEDYQLVLMAASDSDHEPRLYPYLTNGKRRTYRFTGLRLVLLTNINLDGSSRASEMLEPLRSRCWSTRIDAERQEIFDNACYLAICKQMLRFHGANLTKANLALEYFAENMHRLPDVSARTLVKIVGMMNQMPDCWREGMDRECAKTSARRPYTGEIPRIVLG